MRIGAVLPTTEIGADTAAVRSWAVAVERAGFDAVVVYDHVVGAEHRDRTPPITRDYDETTPFREPFVLLGHLAALTSTVELMTGVLVLPQRQTALVAKQAAEVALLSGGRFTLGVGIGWNVVEYDALGVGFAERGRRLDEQVELLRRLWSDGLVSADGRFHRFERVALSPRPDEPVPLVFGGGSEAALSRAVRAGDGFLFNAPSPAALALHATLPEQLAGRDPGGFRVLLQVHACHGAEQLRRSLDPWRDRKVDDVVVSTMRNRMIGADVEVCDGADEHLDLLDRARAVVREVLG
ncbi:hypothetical protein GCM10009836_01180 [Pseudonocardia ailaonensis]|uniref:Luciferase-like domain-containing protein n=1 Tax=Pseudonocardia ailaonensis TaxID=367279 RepID=A0ABN2MIS7_9PSEU